MIIKTYPVIFAGAGPGDPELITVKAQSAMKAADLIIYAGSLVPQAVLKWADPKAELQNSASMHLAQIVQEMITAHRAGKRVLRLHTGDPSLYGAIFEQMAALDGESIPYTVIPGVTAAFAAAAALGIEYTLPEVSQTLILTRMAGRTPVPESEDLALLARHKTSMAIYLSIGMVERVEAVLADAYGRDSVCAVVFRASQPDEKILVTKLKDLAKRVREEKITRQAVIIVGKALNAKKNNIDKKSMLYDKNFKHEFRS
jgi:precorrin-4/cobalt-precorrin-4 C11-methyltransferase